MKATVTGWKTHHSEPHERDYTMLFLRLENGRSTLTYLDPRNRNYRGWEPFLRRGVILDNLRLLPDGKVDADSQPTEVEPPQQQLPLF